MRVVTTFFGVLVSLQLVQSYILLTANVEDVHNLAKQVVASPVVDQISKLARRAYDVFNKQLAADQKKRASGHYNEDKSWPAFRASKETVEEGNGQAGETSGWSNVDRRTQPDILGKDVNFYLKSISKIFEKISK